MRRTFAFDTPFTFAWEAFKARPWFYISACGIAIGVSIVPLVAAIVEFVRQHIGAGCALYGVALLLSMVPSVGLQKIFLKTVDGETPTYQDLYLHARLIPSLLATWFLWMLMVLPCCILVIPGYYVMVRYYFALLVVIDKEVGPMEALRRASELSDGVRWLLLAFILVAGFLGAAGEIVFLVGMLVTMPIAMLAMAHVYRQLDEQTTPGLTPQQRDVPSAPAPPYA